MTGLFQVCCCSFCLIKSKATLIMFGSHKFLIVRVRNSLEYYRKDSLPYSPEPYYPCWISLLSLSASHKSRQPVFRSNHKRNLCCPARSLHYSFYVIPSFDNLCPPAPLSEHMPALICGLPRKCCTCAYGCTRPAPSHTASMLELPSVLSSKHYASLL